MLHVPRAWPERPALLLHFRKTGRPAVPIQASDTFHPSWFSLRAWVAGGRFPEVEEEGRPSRPGPGDMEEIGHPPPASACATAVDAHRCAPLPAPKSQAAAENVTKANAVDTRMIRAMRPLSAP